MPIYAITESLLMTETERDGELFVGAVDLGRWRLEPVQTVSKRTTLIDRLCIGVLLASFWTLMIMMMRAC